MKKIYLAILIFSLAVFGSCTFLDDSYVDRKMTEFDKRLSKLEADMLTVKFELDLVDYEDIEEEEAEVVEEEEEVEVVEEEEEAEVVHTIEITDPKGSLLEGEPIEFKGNVSEGATKIVVKASGIDYTDEYTLTNFEKGDEDFWYKASRSFDNLDYGENKYVFEAHFEDGEVETAEAIINFS